MTYDTTKNPTIFAALHEAITAKDKKELKFARCNNCGRMTPYRLMQLSSRLICKKCGKPILL
jgi:formylmethanofuran dehydrogenase subunit E